MSLPNLYPDPFTTNSPTLVVNIKFESDPNLEPMKPKPNQQGFLKPRPKTHQIAIKLET